MTETEEETTTEEIMIDPETTKKVMVEADPTILSLMESLWKSTTYTPKF